MNNIIKIPTIIGVLFLLAGLAAGIILIQNTKVFRSGAAATAMPKDVRITNITEGSFTVTWRTDSKTVGFVQYGESQNNLGQTAEEETSDAANVHFVDVKNLKEQDTYYFKIYSEGDVYDENGVPWTANTGANIGEPESSIIMSGKIEEVGSADGHSIVIATVPGGSPLSVLTSDSGSWLINLAHTRTSALNSYASIDTKLTVVEILVQGSTQIATAKITPEAGKYTPTIKLGSVNDFTNTLPGGSEVPGSELSLPNNIPTPESKFSVEETNIQGNDKPVTLESIDDGETVNTDTPEFFGEGPPGTEITVTIESDPVTQTANVGANGAWQITTPQNLEPGDHKVTVSWRDALGVLRTFTRSFVVSAAEGPAFEASSSASLTPTPTTTATATATPTLSPTATPLVSPTATTSTVPLPVTGTLTPTIALFIMSVGLVLTACAIAFFVF